ncbi:MAG: cytochrome c peroxidase [Pseudomonadota bacterium]
MAKTVGALAVALLCGTATAAVDDRDSGLGAPQLRQFVDQQVGGIQKLMVPAKNEDLPQPLGTDGKPDPRFKTTEAKRYLGKQLFHDPDRMVRIDPAFGGLPETARTASCGTCHLGEAASKAGTLFNFAVGGEGRGYTDAKGNFIARRRPDLAILPMLRQTPLFPGDALVDELPTLQDVYRDKNTGEIVAGSPALQRKLDRSVFDLIATGRLDALDSVGRNAPSVLGAAFNNRLLQGGFAGEPDSAPGGLNPFGFVAQESVALLLLDAHRLLEKQASELEKFATFRLLFRQAFPEEAAQAPGCVPESPPAQGACDALINDMTALRATATFMRTVVTRNTPWDKFLAGDNSALTDKQRRGAKLFFTKAEDGGAGCFTCHSGPMLNKQPNDPDVAGMGQFVEENFFNLGLADHPLQALNRTVRGPGFRDDGRREITGKDSDAFKFRVLTLRQLKDGRFFFHNGSFTSVRDVVQYFNAGVPQDAVAAAAGTLTPRFTNPRGAGSLPGLGLSERQVDDLTDFLENALYDPAFVKFDPNSTTDTFELNARDTTYSKYRPDLVAAGNTDGHPMIDGRSVSGKPQNNDDPLSRRDMGMEFLDVTAQAVIALAESNTRRGGLQQEDVYKITNNSTSIIDTHLLVIARGLSPNVRLENRSGVSKAGDPYLRVFLPDGVLMPGQSIDVTLVFQKPLKAPPAQYSLTLLSGQGNP